MKRPIMIFAHIPKTGGLTMRNIINHQLPENHIFKYTPNKKNVLQSHSLPSAQIRCIHGHCRFGIHKHVNQPCKYFSILRNPVNRVISAYYFIQSSPMNQLYIPVKNMNLEEFIYNDHPKIKTILENHQTRFICGKKDPDIKLAMDNINRHFMLVGITERYPETVFLLNKIMSWPNFNYKKENVNTSKPKKTVPNELINYIMKKNKLDQILYEHCTMKFNQRIKNLSAVEKGKLHRFIQDNS